MRHSLLVFANIERSANPVQSTFCRVIRFKCSNKVEKLVSNIRNVWTIFFIKINEKFSLLVEFGVSWTDARLAPMFSNIYLSIYDWLISLPKNWLVEIEKKNVRGKRKNEKCKCVRGVSWSEISMIADNQW